MMACVICVSCWEASHCIACVAASTSMVRLVVVTVLSLSPFFYLEKNRYASTVLFLFIHND